MKISLNSVVLGTRDLVAMRGFYESMLGLAVGNYTAADGTEKSDCSDSYVNYEWGSAILGFEVADRADRCSIVLAIDDGGALKDRLMRAGVTFTEGVTAAGQGFFRASDPEGRELILEFGRG